MSTFFSTIADSRRRGTYDSLLELRSYESAALSATASETGVEFASRKSDGFKICLAIAPYTGYVATTAEWVITVEVSDVVDGTYTTVGTFTPDGNQIDHEIALSGGMIDNFDADAEFIRVTVTKTGAPGDLTYGAWIVPN